MGQIYHTTLQKTTEAYNVTRNMLYMQEATVHISPEQSLKHCSSHSCSHISSVRNNLVGHFVAFFFQVLLWCV